MSFAKANGPYFLVYNTARVLKALMALLAVAHNTSAGDTQYLT